MRNYITIYDDILNLQYCRDLIDRFETKTQCHEIVQKTNQEWRMDFTQINLYEHEPFKHDVVRLTELFKTAIEQYKKDNQIESYQWPSDYGFEQIRMKRYLPDSQERFDLHVDVSDHDSARRFLVAFFYLNDDFTGGETDFPQMSVMAKPKTGRLIMFPPMWGWPHRSNPIQIGSPKYIIGTYLQYK